MNYMGIDIGSSGCKAAVFNEDGQQVAIANQEYNVIFTKDGGAELDSNEVMEKCFQVIQQCTSQVEKKSIKGLGISSQGEAFTAIGAQGQALCNAMISSDMRSQPFVNKWLDKFNEDRLYQITGHTAHPMFSLFKLLWLKENKTEVWENSKKFLCFEDLLQLRLGLEPAIGWSLAGRTMMFDVRKHEWSEEILEMVGIDSNQLATPKPSGSVVGTVTSNIANELGLSDNTFVVTGGHDQPCGALGAGVTKPDIAMYATGSVECITPGFDKAIFTDELKKNNLCTYDHTVEGMYVTVAFSLTGGNILKWFRDEFGASEIAKAKTKGENVYELLLNAIPKNPTDLLVLPYFTPSGTPYFDTETKGAILGLRLSTTRGEFLRALLEGVAFEMRLNLDILEKSGHNINELRAVGGGAQSEIWTQLKADVTGKKITTLNVTEAGCLGVAMLVCAADTGRPVDELAADWVKTVSVINPINENKKWYNDRFRMYRNLYKDVKDFRI